MKETKNQISEVEKSTAQNLETQLKIEKLQVRLANLNAEWSTIRAHEGDLNELDAIQCKIDETELMIAKLKRGAAPLTAIQITEEGCYPVHAISHVEVNYETGPDTEPLVTLDLMGTDDNTYVLGFDAFRAMVRNKIFVAGHHAHPFEDRRFVHIPTPGVITMLEGLCAHIERTMKEREA